MNSKNGQQPDFKDLLAQVQKDLKKTARSDNDELDYSNTPQNDDGDDCYCE